MTAKIFVCFKVYTQKDGGRGYSKKVRSWKADGQVVNNMVDPRKLNPESIVEKEKQTTQFTSENP